MFKNLKKKIAQETGQNVDDFNININNNNIRHSLSTTHSSQDSKDEEISSNIEDVIS